MANKKPKKILFITPGASRAGGNIIFLNFLKWFKQNSEIPFVTIYGHSGVLESEFKALSNAFNFTEDGQPNNLLLRKIYRRTRRENYQQEWIKRQIEKENIGLIYNNAVINYEILAIFANLRVPVISHCHELESVIHRTGLAEFVETAKMTTHFIAVAEVVRQNLIKNHQVPSEKISLVHGFIPIENFSTADLQAKRRKILEELEIPQTAFIVGASGTMYWRKAPEIFIQIARAVRQKNADALIYFLWVGGAEKDDFKFFEVNYDIEKLNLERHVHFLEHKSNPLEYFAAFDVFALTSREEPFGLVCLETASLGSPMICFDRAGGGIELVEEDSGFVVPYLDIEAFADKILTLYTDTQLKEKMGNRAAQKVRQRHDILTSAPEIVDIIEKFWIA